MDHYSRKPGKKLSVKKITGAIFLLLLSVFLVSTVYKSVKKYITGETSLSSDILDSHIKHFGVALPRGYKIHGVDISHHQKHIEWLDVASTNVNGNQIKFAIIKATEGITRQDRHFSENWAQSKEAGLIRGAYHFYYPTRDAEKQARNFIKQVTLEKGDLPPVLDIEVSKNKTKAEIVEGCARWCDIIEEHYGVKPIIYTSVNFYDMYLKDDFEDYPLWIAHYQQEVPRITHRSWIFWQHTDAATIKGIGNNVDLNVFNGDIDELIDLCIP